MKVKNKRIGYRKGENSVERKKYQRKPALK